MKNIKEIIVKKDILKMSKYIVIIIACFYLLPLLNSLIGNTTIIMLNIIPLVCFVVSFFYGFKENHIVIFSIIIALAFIPAIFIFFDLSAIKYVFIYGLLAIIGSFIGLLVKKITLQK